MNQVLTNQINTIFLFIQKVNREKKTEIRDKLKLERVPWFWNTTSFDNDGEFEVAYLINVNRQGRAVGKSIPITACCAHIKVPWLAASCQKAYLSHKTHNPVKKWKLLADFNRHFLLQLCPPSLNKDLFPVFRDRGFARLNSYFPLSGPKDAEI